MIRQPWSSPPTLVAILTPPGRAAVATVVVEGEDAVAAVAKFFQSATGRSLQDAPLRRIVYGQWRSPEGSAGEGIVVCRTAPRRVEIHGHGGKAATAAIVAALVSVGCREVDWRFWTAATEGDSLRADARIALAEARTRRTASILLDQHAGALRQGLNQLVMELESNAEDGRRRLERLLQLASLGLRLIRPWRVVLAGRPNVGKSSLINALVGYRRSIVYDTPGVTRDVVTAATALDGWPVELADTAGVRDSADPLETAGVERTRRALQAADLAVLIFDATQPWTADDAALLSTAPAALVVHNKCDLVNRDLVATREDRPPGIWTSAATGEGLSQLTQAMVTSLAPLPPEPGEAVPFMERHVEILRRAQTLLNSDNPSAAAQCLRELLKTSEA